MINTKEMSEDELDLLKAKIGGSKLHLKARTPHNCFIPIVKQILSCVGSKYKQEVNNIVSCTVTSLKRGDLGFTYSRDKSTYTLFNNTSKFKTPSSYIRTLRLLELLEDEGYIDNYKGFNDRKGERSNPASILFKDKYIKLFESELIEKHASKLSEDSVVIRGEDGLPLSNVQGKGKQQFTTDAINTWLWKYDFYFGAYPKKVQLQQVYNQDLDSSGRYYFGGLQTISSFKRMSYRVYGDSVTEQDYVSMHFRIIACLANINLEDDFEPYGIDISDLIEVSGGYCKKRARSIVKLACLMLVNSGNPTTSLKNAWRDNLESITTHITNEDYKRATSNIFYGVSGMHNCNEIIKRLKQHNAFASDFFKDNKDSWRVLQGIDAKIMERVLIRMMDKDKPMLPYHDSALCRKEDKDYLIYCMKEAWCDILNTYDNCIIDEKF